MFRHIVVPLDGSDFSMSALPHALALTGPESVLELVSALDSRAMLSGAGFEGNLTAGAPALGSDIGIPVGATEMLEASRSDREEQLRSLAEEVEAMTPSAEVRWTVLEGEPSDAVAAHVDRSGADVVVMSTHGRGGLERAWLGSVADRLVRHVAVPVLLIRPPEDAADQPALDRPPDIRRLLVPLDGSRLAEAALEPATRLARESGAALILLRVSGPELSIGSPYLPHAAEEQAQHFETKRRQAGEYLDKVASALRSEGTEVDDVEVRSGTAAETILEVAAEGADLIVMATHGRGGLRRWVLGSVSDKVLRGGELPLLLVRPPEGHEG